MTGCAGYYYRAYFEKSRYKVKSKEYNKTARAGIFRGPACDKLNKGVWGMPRLSEAKKDVISCEKLREGAHDR